MRQKLKIEQRLIPRLSGQQIQFIKLLQVPVIALNDYISKEISNNPLLDEELGTHNEEEPNSLLQEEATSHPTPSYSGDMGVKSSYPRQQATDRATWTPAVLTIQEKLMAQLHLQHLNEIEYLIGEYIIGSLDQDGYLKCELEIIVKDIYITHYEEVSLQQAEKVLHVIQQLDPPGIGARNLQECLLLQLQMQSVANPVVQLAHQIIRDCFEPFVKKAL